MTRPVSARAPTTKDTGSVFKSTPPSGTWRTPSSEAKGHALGVHGRPRTDDHGACGPGTGGGRNRGHGGAAGPGPRSTAELGRARWARNPAARRTWAEAELGRAPRREEQRTRRGSWSGTPEYAGPGPLGAQHSRTPNVGRGRGEEGLLATVRTDAAAGPLGRTPPGVRLLEAVGRLPPEVVYGGDRLQVEEMERQRAQQLSEAGGRRPRAFTAAAKAKRARTASAAAHPTDDDSDDN